MTLALVYWILMLLWLVSGVAGHFLPGPYGSIANSIFFFILFLIIGFKLFGAPIHG